MGILGTVGKRRLGTVGNWCMHVLRWAGMLLCQDMGATATIWSVIKARNQLGVVAASH